MLKSKYIVNSSDGIAVNGSNAVIGSKSSTGINSDIGNGVTNH